MIVHVARLGDDGLDSPADAFLALAASSDSVRQRHVLAARPENADVILFTQAHLLNPDWRLKQIAKHPLVRRYPERIFVYDERDRPWCAFPGVYVSMPGHLFDPKRQRAWSYYRVAEASAAAEPDLLFSFLASPTARCREPLFRLRHPDAVVERIERFTFFDPNSLNYEARREHFSQTIARSRFVLCPRGVGTSSIRLYETLAAGRVPVIIADDWVPPRGPEWDTFSVRWPEGKTEGLVLALEQRLSEWSVMAERARAAHRNYFAESSSASIILDLCEELHTAGAGQNRRAMDRGYLEAWGNAARRRAEGTVRSQGGRALRRVGVKPPRSVSAER